MALVRRGAAGLLTLATALSLVLTGCDPPKTTTTGARKPAAKTTTKVTTQSGATVKITTSKNTCWAGRVGSTNKQGCGSATIQVKSSNGNITVNLRKTKGPDGLSVVLVVNGKKVDSGRVSSSSSVVVSSSN